VLNLIWLAVLAFEKEIVTLYGSVLFLRTTHNNRFICDAFRVVASSQVIGFCYDLIGIDRMRLNKLNFTKNDLNNLDKITVVAF